MDTRRRKREDYTGEYYEYLKDRVEEYDETQTYYEEYRVRYKNKPYECIGTTTGTFDDTKWERKNEDEAYYNDVPTEFFMYGKVFDNKGRQNSIDGLRQEVKTVRIRTSASIDFKANDRIKLQYDDRLYKVDDTGILEQDETDRFPQMWQDYENYQDKVLFLV